jgi:hypothetical protein
MALQSLQMKRGSAIGPMAQPFQYWQNEYKNLAA